MSVKGYSGRDFWIVRNDEILAGVRSKTAAFPRSIIDRSDEEFDGWRHLEPIPESTSLQVDVSGITKPDNLVLLQDWLGSTFLDVYLKFPDGTVVEAADGAFLQSLEHTGEYRGMATFNAVFLFSGLVTIIERILVTSKMYAIEFDDSARASGAEAAGGRFSPQFLDDVAGQGATVNSGSMVNPVTTYGDWPPDEAAGQGATLNSGSMESPTTVYENWPPDEVAGQGATINSGEMVNPVVTYGDWPPDEVAGHGATINAGSMYIDEFFEQVTSLLHFEGPDESTTITDEIGNTWSASGAAELDTSDPIAGTSSLLLPAGEAYVSNSSGAWAGVGTGDFTIEWTQRLSALGAYTLIDMRPSETNGIYPLVASNADGTIRYFVNGSNRIVSSAGALSTGVKQHIAICRESGTTRLFVDGSFIGSWSDSSNYSDSITRIGRSAFSASTTHPQGQFDEFRVTLAARYTSSFTPPSLPYPNE